jgi:dihydrodipicolinate synthase/N-acetylneuraminate lyase
MSARSINTAASPDHRERLSAGIFSGVITPLITPRGETIATLNKRDLGKLIRDILPMVNGLFVAGKAGEGPDLSINTWSNLVTATQEEVRLRFLNFKPVVAGVLKKDPNEVF